MRIVATADNHLGRYYARMPFHTLEERRRRLRQALREVFQYARQIQADLVILGGDLFDTPNPRNPDRIFLARELHQLRQEGVAVVAIGGNHDTPRSSSEEGGYLPLSVYAELGATHLFDQLPEDKALQPLYLERSGFHVAIGGFTPNPNLPRGYDPLEGITFEADADFRVLILHGAVEGTIHPEANEPVLPISSLERLSQSADLIVVGNVHRFAQLRAGRACVVIPGATEWMHYGEVEMFQPGFVTITIESREAVAVEHCPVTPQPRAEIAFHASELPVEDPTGAILERLQPLADPERLVRTSLEGVIDHDAYMRLELGRVEEEARRLFFFFEMDTTHLAVRSGNRVEAMTRRSMGEELRAAVERRLARALDPEEKVLLEETRNALLAELGEVAR